MSLLEDLDDYKLEAVFQRDPDCVIHRSYKADRARGLRNVVITETWVTQKPLFGSGTFGTVSLQKQLGAACNTRAVKQLSKMQMTKLKVDYRKELLALTKFSRSKFAQHEIFVEFLGWFEDDTSVFLAMEYFHHGTLNTYMTVNMKENDAQIISFQLLEGLKLMHEQGFTHRDLKPQNIFVAQKSPHWWVKIGDFGITKRISNDDTALQTATGTPNYLAPEVFQYFEHEDEENESSQYTNAVDLWSFGCVVYEIMALQVPFPVYPRSIVKFCKGGPFPEEPLASRMISKEGIGFIKSILIPHPASRPTVSETMEAQWLRTGDSRRTILASDVCSSTNFDNISVKGGRKGDGTPEDRQNLAQEEQNEEAKSVPIQDGKIPLSNAASAKIQESETCSISWSTSATSTDVERLKIWCPRTRSPSSMASSKDVISRGKLYTRSHSPRTASRRLQIVSKWVEDISQRPLDKESSYLVKMDGLVDNARDMILRLSRASTFQGNERHESRSSGTKRRVVYESVSESESDTPVYIKPANSTREIRTRTPPQKHVVYESVSESDAESNSPIQPPHNTDNWPLIIGNTSQSKVVRDPNELAERVIGFGTEYKITRESRYRLSANHAEWSPRRPKTSSYKTDDKIAAQRVERIPYPDDEVPPRSIVYRRSRSFSPQRIARLEQQTKANIMQKAYRFIKALNREKIAATAKPHAYVPDCPVIETFEEDPTKAQSYSKRSRNTPVGHDEPSLQDFEKGYDPEARFSSYPTVNQSSKREKIAPRKLSKKRIVNRDLSVESESSQSQVDSGVESELTS